MSAPVSLTEAKLFLRVEHEAEDGLIQTLIDAARARVEREVGVSLTSTSPAPLRLAVMMLVMRAYERGDGEMSAVPVEGGSPPIAWCGCERGRDEGGGVAGAAG